MKSAVRLNYLAHNTGVKAKTMAYYLRKPVTRRLSSRGMGVGRVGQELEVPERVLVGTNATTSLSVTTIVDVHMAQRHELRGPDNRQ